MSRSRCRAAKPIADADCEPATSRVGSFHFGPSLSTSAGPLDAHALRWRSGSDNAQARVPYNSLMYAAEPSMSLAIETQRLTRYFDDFCAVNGIELRVERGTFYG